MKKFINIMILITFMVVFFSCATSVPVKISKPGEINMTDARSIIILDYDYPETSTQSSVINATASFRKTVATIIIGKKNTSKLESKVADYATTKTTQILLNTNYFTIIDTNTFKEAVIKSNNKNITPVEVGQLAGAEAIFVGQITNMKRDVEKKIETYTDKNKKKVQRTYYVQNVSLSMSYSIMDTWTGEIIAVKDFNGSRSEKKYNQSEFTDEYRLYTAILDRIIPSVGRQLAPYTVTEYRSLMKDKTKDKQMERADLLVQNYQYQAAYDLFSKIYDSNMNVAAGYNAAIMLEILGNIDGAIEYMNRVSLDTLEKRASREVLRLKRTKEQMEQAAAQMK